MLTPRNTMIAALRVCLSLLTLLVVCVPTIANTNGFHSTSPYTNLSSRIQQPAVHQPYRSTIYQPFSDVIPSTANSAGSDPSSDIGSRRNANIGIPSWGGTMSEPLPIGDTVPLILFAATMIAIIVIRQRRNQHQTKTQSLNTSNNNIMSNTTHRSSNRLHKFFLLLSFVCFMGQVSGQTFKVTQLFKKAESSSNRPTNFPEGYDANNYTSSKNNPYKNAQQATYINGAFYTSDPVSLGSGKIVKITQEGTVSEFATNVTNLRMGICRDDVGNLIVNTSTSNTHPLTLTVYPAGTNGPTTSGKKTIKFGTDDNNRVANQSNFISAKGDVLNGTGYVYFYPANKNFVQIVTIKNGAYYSITKHTNLDATAGAAGGYVIPISGTSHYIYNERSVQSSDDAHRGYYLYQSGDKGVLLANKNYSQTAPDRNATYGGAYFTVAGHNMFVYGSGSNYYGGWSMRDLSNSETVIHTESALGSGGTSYANPSCGAFFTWEKVNNYIINLYEYCQGNGIAGWEIRGAVSKDVRIQTHDSNSNGTNKSGNWKEDASGGTIKLEYTSNSSNTSTSANITTSGYKYYKDIKPSVNIKLTADAKGEYTFIGWWNNGATYTSNPWQHLPENSNQSITARFAKLKQQTINIHTYNPTTGEYTLNNAGGTAKIKYNNALTEGDIIVNLTSSSGSYKALINDTITLTATAKSDYAFVGWYNGSTCLSTNATYTYSATAENTIIARFAKKITRTFQTQIYDGTQWTTSTTGGTVNITYNGTQTTSTTNTNPLQLTNLHEGSQVQLQANANTGYTFLHWQCQWSRSSYTNCTIYALDSIYNFNNSEYTNDSYTARFAKYNQQNFNIRTYSSNSDTYIADAAGGKIAIAYTYKKFKSLLSADKTLVTHEDEIHSFYIADVNNHSHDIIEGTSITLTATPRPGYKFIGWYQGNTQLSASLNYIYAVATSGITITARFERAEQTHTVSVMTYDPTYNKYLLDDPGGSITYTVRVPGSSTPLQEVTTTTAASFIATTGNDVTITATAREGYKFAGWYEGEELIANPENPTYIYTASDITRHFIARFVPEKCMKLTIVPNSAGTYVVKYGNFNDEDTTNFYAIESSLTDTVIAYGPDSLSYGVSSIKPILGYKFHMMYPNANTNPSYNFDLNEYSTMAQTTAGGRLVVVDFVRTEEQMVYLHLNNQWGDNNHKYYIYATNIARKNQQTRIDEEFRWIEMTKVGDIYKVNDPIPANTYSHIVFVQFAANTATPTLPLSELTAEPTNKTSLLTIPATRFNCYKLKSYYKHNGFVDAWTTCPATDGDFRLLYREISNNNYTHTSDVIKQSVSGAIDTVSLHIYKDKAPTITLQQRTNGTWTDIQTISTTSLTNGVWNFAIQQNGSSATVSTNVKPYIGNYYIRTANARGMYQDYTHPDNIMTYSAYADEHSDFSHYYCRYIDIPAQDQGDGNRVGTYTSVKFAVANKHAYLLAKELVINNDRFTDDEYGDDNFVEHREGQEPRLSVDANVRFGYDSKTNRLTRAYIADSKAIADDYLVLEGTNINPTSKTFSALPDYLYSADLQAKPSATATVKATTIVDINDASNAFHNEQRDQYFFGTSTTPKTLIEGVTSSQYFPIRVVYDFKEDRFTTIYTPNNDITGTINLETPVMIMREHNNPTTQITFSTNDSKIVLPSGDDAFEQPAYAVMTFLGDILTNPTITHHEKMFYWVSFPFNVKISEVFGLGDYGQYWIMQYYDGKQRDDYGLKYTNWQYILDTEAVLEANQGYIICLNYSQLVADGIAQQGNKISLYFPSLNIIPSSSLQRVDDVTVSLEEYTSNKAWYHNNWHVIGVPSFANPGVTHNQGDATFIYEYWHPGDAYAAKAADEITFQSMYAYMVQYAGDITWTGVVNTPPSSLAARHDATAEERIMLRLELQQAGNMLDKTYVQLRDEDASLGFDLNKDLSKVINAGANIYSVVNAEQMAGNVILKSDELLPLGVVITATGEYTFAMPRGTGNRTVELIDYETDTRTNLLLSDYTVTLSKGTIEGRFALNIHSDKTATSVENIGKQAQGGQMTSVKKFLINGVLYLQKDNTLYDAQGHLIRQCK